MIRYTNATALITGASSGIGEEFARQLATRGMHLILVARSEDKLYQLANELAGRYAIRADVIAADLSRPEGVQAVIDETQRRGLRVDLLVNNAGFGTYGPFETIDPQREQDEIMLNVAALLGLTHAFIPPMLARGAGAVINVASVAGFQPLPYMAVYAATKAFVLSFSEALWGEYRNRGVRVLALCPGPVATSFFDVAKADERLFFSIMQAQPVVARALEALERDWSFTIPGLTNYIMSCIGPRLSPRSVVVWVARQMIQPR